jgi:hypothetical protein
LVHRALPLFALIVLVVSASIGLRDRLEVRLGWPEIIAVGYLVATVLSLLYTGVDVALSASHIYDRIFVPLILYLLIRLLEPDEAAFLTLVPVTIFVLYLETFVGIAAWISPGVVPGAWLPAVSERTTGTLRETNLFGVTVLASGVLLLHVASSKSWPKSQRSFLYLSTGVALAMTIYTFSRAVWLASAVTMVGLLFLHPLFVRRFIATVAVILLVALSSGALVSQTELAGDRFRSEKSEESALSRLPVMVASVRMFEAKPVFGFGYENFDRYDLGFQSRIGDLYFPDKDHASHNVFLTIMAEQGIVGIGLFIGPFLYWFGRFVRHRHKVPTHGILSRALLWSLWLLILAQFVVHNFSRLQVPFGFGLLWITLGLIGSVLTVAIRNYDDATTADASERCEAPRMTRTS